MSPAPLLPDEHIDDDDLVIDLSDTQEATFEPLPAGIYNVIIETAEFVKAKESGNPMIKVMFSVTEEPYENRKFFQNWMLTEQGKPFLKRYLNSLSYPSDSFSVQQLLSDLPGKICRVKVRKRIYEGAEVNNVTDVLAAEGGGELPGGDADLPT